MQNDKTWELREDASRNLLSVHPNKEGARLSSMHHVRNGQKVTWKVGPGVEYGLVAGERRFVIMSGAAV